MGDTRAIYFYFDNDDLDVYFDFGTYVLMLYHVEQLNKEKSKIAYDATLSDDVL